MINIILHRVSAAFCVLGLLAACSTNPALEESRQAFASGSPDVALSDLQAKVVAEPTNLELRAYYLRQREILTARQLMVAELARASGRFDEAEAALMLARKYDPDQPRVAAGLETIAAQKRRNQLVQVAEQRFAKGDFAGAESAVRSVLAAEPSSSSARALQRRLDEHAVARDPLPVALKGPFAKPVNLEFRDAQLRGVFEALSRASGLNFVLDKDVRPDAKVTIFVRNSSIDDVLKLLMVTQQLERKLLNENSVLIYPNTPAKQKDYQELVTRSFYLANADPKQAMAMIKQMVKTKDLFVEEKLNLLVMKDTPGAVRLAERLIEDLDLAEPEVMLEVEVMEISRNKLLELGVRFPDQIGYGLLQPNTTSAVTTTTGTTISQNLGGQLLSGNVNLRNTGAMVPFVANPGLLLNLKDQDGNANILANPRIRVKNRDKAKIHIGEKLPVFTTTSTANVGVSASVNYLDVGLKLEVEPSVHLNDEVAIKVNLEVSSVVKEVSGPSASLAYQVGTRSAITSLRLHDGETQVLAGLISDEERRSANRLPGLGELPGVGRLFSSQRDVNNKTEIVLLITPRVIRNVARPNLASATQAAGTEGAVGAQPLLVGSTLAGGLAIKPSGGASVLPSLPEGGSAPQMMEKAPLLQLIGPVTVRAGEEFLIGVRQQSAGIEAADLTLSFDRGLVEPADQVAEATNDRSLRLPAGTSSMAQIRFRALRAVSGAASFRLGPAALKVGGQDVQVDAPAPFTVQVTP
jgi:general secretion pathway protein D